MPRRNQNLSIGQIAFAGATVWWLTKKLIRGRRRIDLHGKTVLITGGSRGLGLGLAREFARQGARIAICARNPDELAAAKRDIQQITSEVHTFTCDLQDPALINRLIDEVESSCGPINLLVNNAGTIIVGPAESMGIEDYHKAMDVNFWAAVHTTQVLVPRMKVRGFGRIVNIASVGGKMPVSHLAPYCVSKFALVGFSTAMRSELAKDGIVVTTINPGLMRTGSPRNATFKGNHQAEYAWFSVSDALPGISMSTARAARLIVDAAIHGDAEVTLGLPAKIASAIYGLAPNLHAEIASLINSALPGVGDNLRSQQGYQSESWFTRHFIPRSGRRAEQDFNQLNT